MKRRSNWALVIALSGMWLVYSCQKEVRLQNDQPGGINNPPNPPNSTIVGNWNFVGMTGSTTGVINASLPGQQVKINVSNVFATKNSAGTVNINDSQFVATGVSYQIDTTVHLVIYVNDSLYGEMDTAFVANLPPSNDTAPYTRVNNDSLYFPNGFVIPADPLSGGTDGAVGTRIGWSGDTLLLKISTPFTRAVSQSGVPGTFTGVLNGTVKLKKP